ncbi:hypothetical protein GCM10010140_22890 [Streptosporangium pseudovulgare]|uniref:Uncharacterized protein n=1 Tax=Streptosporangium pseudovulgare TaxID=35765 RepID=A0ABQ2QQF2_9ACTN|nr:hypothetical protein GCM10010140_22890 [Streptosporangium pseudovulgare]
MRGETRGDTHGETRGDTHGETRGDAHGEIRGGAHGEIRGGARGEIRRVRDAAGGGPAVRGTMTRGTRPAACGGRS